jgi:hypothetical protein
MCPVKIVSNPGIVMSQMCMDLTFQLSGMLMGDGLGLTHMLTTSTPSKMKMGMAPVSAIACIVAIMIVFKYLCKGWPNMLWAVAVID